MAGLLIDSGSLVITGSAVNNVNTITVASLTSSIDCNLSNILSINIYNIYIRKLKECCHMANCMHHCVSNPFRCKPLQCIIKLCLSEGQQIFVDIQNTNCCVWIRIHPVSMCDYRIVHLFESS